MTGSGSGSSDSLCREWITPENEGPIPLCTVIVYATTENESNNNCRLCLNPVEPETGSGTGNELGTGTAPP